MLLDTEKEMKSVVPTSPRLIAFKRPLLLSCYKSPWPLMWAKIGKSWRQRKRVNDKTKSELLL